MFRPLALVCVLALSFAPVAQDSHRPELSDRQKDFMKEVQKGVDLHDNMALNKLFRRETQIAREILDAYCFAYAATGDGTLFDDIKSVVQQTDNAEDGKRLQKRVEFMLKLKEDERGVWVDLQGRINNAYLLFDEAQTKKEEEVWKKAIALLEDVVAMATKLGDLEHASHARYYLGIAHDGISQYDRVVADYKKALEEWVEAGRPAGAEVPWMKSRVEALAAKGYDPENKPKEGTDPAAPTPPATKTYSKTSYKEGSQFQEWVGDYKEMNAPDQFPSVSPWNADFLQLWREFNFSEKGGEFNLGTLAQAAPFGKPLKVVRDGSHAFLRQGEDKKGDVPVKVLDGKPTLASIKGDEKDAERYAVFLATGGQNATFMQTPMNYQTLGRYRSGWYREAKVLGETLVLLDDNSSGVLGDPLEVRDNITTGGPEWIDVDGILVGKKLMPLGDVVPIGGKWYHLELGDLHGKQIRTRELDIETGQVVLKWNGPVAPRVLVIGEMHELKGCFYDVAGGKPVTVPVGHYQIAYGVLETGKSAQMKQAWIYRGEAKQFDVVAKQTTTLDMGGPYKLEFEQKGDAKQVTVKGKSLLVREKSGAVIGRVVDEVLCPEVWTRPGTTGNGTVGKPMSKADSKAREADGAAIWFPANYVIDRAKDQKIQVQLKLAKHPLLGGPFTSDWK